MRKVLQTFATFFYFSSNLGLELGHLVAIERVVDFAAKTRKKVGERSARQTRPNKPVDVQHFLRLSCKSKAEAGEKVP